MREDFGGSLRLLLFDACIYIDLAGRYQRSRRVGGASKKENGAEVAQVSATRSVE